MGEHLKEYLAYVPIVLGIIYLSGFVIITSYLSDFDFLRDNILSINYLSAGMSFLVFCTPMVLIVYAGGKSWKYLFIATMYYTLFIDICVFDSDFVKDWSFHFSVFVLIASTSSFYLLRHKWVFEFTAILLLSYHVLSLILFIDAINLFLKMLLMGVSFATFIYNNGDSLKEIASLSMLIFFHLSTCFMFGSVVYGTIPPRYGGTDRDEVRCFVDPEILHILEEIEITVDSSSSFLGRIRYSTENNILITSQEKTFSLPKTAVIVYVK